MKENNCGIDPGTMVVAKLDGRSGMVVEANLYAPRILVRFPNNQQTINANKGVQSDPYSEIYMQCFEVDRKE